MLSLQRVACLFFPLILGTWADQITKSMARELLTPGPPLSYFFGIIQLQYVENRGGFLGYLNGIPETPRLWLLTFGVGTLLVATAILLLRYNRLTLLQRIAGSFILAGGTGNIVDRIYNNGGVTDFIIIGISPIQSGIFNLADVFILAGAFYLGFTYATQDSATFSSTGS